MLLDANLQLSAAQAVTATAVSTNTIDLGQNRDLGPGEDLYAVITVDVSAAAAGAATVNFQLIASDTANLASPTILSQTDAIGKAELTAGREPIAIEIPHTYLAANPKGQRYLGLQYTVGTGPLTAGSFTCYIGKAPATSKKFYPSGFSVA